jgi:pilus assembly protein Flp/PilA
LLAVNLSYGIIFYSELTETETTKRFSKSREISCRFRVVLINHHMELIMKTIFSAVQAFVADEDGVTAIEYGLIAALIGVAMASVAQILGSEITATFQSVVNALTGTPSAS